MADCVRPQGSSSVEMLKLARDQRRSGEAIWFKVLGMLNQIWALVETLDGGTRVRFFDDAGDVFDRLDFPDHNSAICALDFNEFVRLRDRSSFLSVAPLPRFPLRDAGLNLRPVYSSGEHWQPAPATHRVEPARVQMSAPDNSLERFVEAQDPVWFAVLEELLAGRKQTHWMWFVFPQLRGLGLSYRSQYYGLDSIVEARAYFTYPLLRERLILASNLMVEANARKADDILGAVDAIKLQSNATIFRFAAPDERVFSEVLKMYFAGKPCERTLRALSASTDR